MENVSLSRSGAACAQRVLEALKFDADVLALMESDQLDTSSLTSAALASAINGGFVLRLWRRIGRQVLMIHPALVDATRLADSSSIPTDIFRTLPYQCPMVVFPQPLKFDGYTVEEIKTHYGLVGFVAYSTQRRSGGRNEGVLSTADADATALGIVMIANVLDDDGKIIDVEGINITIDYGELWTITEMVDDILARFDFSGVTVMDDARDVFFELLRAVVGCLLYLCSTVVECERVPYGASRRLVPKPVSRQPLSFYRVGWTTGSALALRESALVRDSKPSQQIDVAHQQEPQHRRAHFKYQAYGPGRVLRKLIFISPYWTHREQLTEQGVNTVRKVL